MTPPNRDTLFQPNLSKAESKAESVSRIAKSMIEQDVAKRDAKTARLREARLAMEAEAQKATKPVKAAKPAKAAAARSTARRSVSGSAS